MFILCLDKNIPRDAFMGKNNASVRAVQTMTGFGSRVNGGNRWHDKTIQVKHMMIQLIIEKYLKYVKIIKGHILQYIVSADGYVGMEYEHSPCEGVPIAVLHDYVLKYM